MVKRIDVNAGSYRVDDASFVRLRSARSCPPSSPPVLEGAMRRESALWEDFVLRFEEALERYRKRRLTTEIAGLGQRSRPRRHPSPRESGVRPARLTRPSGYRIQARYSASQPGHSR